MKAKKKIFKVLLIGDSHVGKTNLMMKYCKDQFSDHYKPTIGADFMVKNEYVEKEDKWVTLQIWDTAGQERFNVVGSSYYRGADACVLVYDCTRHESFKNLSTWRDEFLIHAQPPDPDTYPFVVVGNKIDLPTRHVQRKRAEEWCKKQNGSMLYFETSAKENIQVEEAFEAVAELALANSPVLEEDDGLKVELPKANPLCTLGPNRGPRAGVLISMTQNPSNPLCCLGNF